METRYYTIYIYIYTFLFACMYMYLYTHIWLLALLNNEILNAGIGDMERAYRKKNTQKHILGDRMPQCSET